MKITIQHILSNTGDAGPTLAYSELDKLEVIDLRRFIYFRVNWDPDSSDMIKRTGVKILRIEFVYDGISNNLEILKNEEFDCIDGTPAPVIRYTVDRDIDEEEFKRCVWHSGMVYAPAARRVSGEEPCYAEDHNGKTKVVSYDVWADFARNNGIHLSKQYDFPNGVSCCDGPSLPAIEFAVLKQ